MIRPDVDVVQDMLPRGQIHYRDNYCPPNVVRLIRRVVCRFDNDDINRPVVGNRPSEGLLLTAPEYCEINSAIRRVTNYLSFHIKNFNYFSFEFDVLATVCVSDSSSPRCTV